MELGLRLIEKGEECATILNVEEIGVLAFSPLIIYTHKDITFIGRCDTIAYHLMYVTCEAKGYPIPLKTDIRKEYLSMRHLNIDKLALSSLDISTRNKTVLNSEGLAIMTIHSELTYKLPFYKTILSIVSNNSINRLPKKFEFIRGAHLDIILKEYARGSSKVVDEKPILMAGIWREHLMALGASKSDSENVINAVLENWVTVLNDKKDKNVRATKG